MRSRCRLLYTASLHQPLEFRFCRSWTGKTSKEKEIRRLRTVSVGKQHATQVREYHSSPYCQFSGSEVPPPVVPPKVIPSSAGTGRGVGPDTSPKRSGPVSWTGLFLAAVAAASAVTYFRIERERRLERAMGKVVSGESDGWSPSPNHLAKRVFVPTPYGWFPKDDGWNAAGKPAIGGPWSLVDMEGNLVTEQSFAGKWLLLYFGFARCPDICPSEMNKIGQVLDTLKRDHEHLYRQIVPIFVSVDPARDSIRVLKAYKQDFHPDYIMLTGTPQQVQQMAKKYRVYVSKADETEDDYLVDHSIVTYFHDPTGDLSDCFTQSMRATDVVQKIVEKMNYKPKSFV